MMELTWRNVADIPENCRRIWGRTTESLRPLRLFWTGSALEFETDSSEVWIDIRSGFQTLENWIDIVVDGALLQRFMPARGAGRICLFRGMERNRFRNVRVIRDSQAQPQDPENSLSISAVGMDGIFRPLSDMPLKLEFIGDSITTGEGACGAKQEMSWVPSLCSATVNYAYLTSEMLGARYNVLSQSGWGAFCSWEGNPLQAMPLYYDQICGVLKDDAEASAPWNFGKFQPDAVIVNLGTNDAGSFRNPDWKDPETGNVNRMRLEPDGSMNRGDMEKIARIVISFFTEIRRRNPRAHIVWCIGMLGNELLPLIEDAAGRYRAASGDDNIGVLELPDASVTDYGSREHPGPECQRAAAARLSEYLKDRLGLCGRESSARLK